MVADWPTVFDRVSHALNPLIAEMMINTRAILPYPPSTGARLWGVISVPRLATSNSHPLATTTLRNQLFRLITIVLALGVSVATALGDHLAGAQEYD